jgi:folate-binding protein YgfZ
VTTEIGIELDGQYRAMREGAGVVDRSPRGKLLVRGADAADYLQGQLTNDLEGLAPEQGCYAALLDRKGHMQADMRVLRTEDGVWIDMEPDALGVVLRHLSMYKIGREVELADESGDWAILSLIGPAARSALDLEPPGEEHAFVEGEHGLYVATHLGVDVICPAADADAVRLALGLDPVSDEAAECLRVEAGRPRFGVDFDTETIPEEAGLNERAVSFTKGCYVGQETVARLHYKGKPNRHLRGLSLSDEAPPGTELWLGERSVGRLGSVAVSPVHGPIALAVVRREAGPGDELRVGDTGASATVVELPFGVS